ncbi:hypothetical protein K438DRAFT_1957628 [Mycena galopus ATCC 62051]|nr:hypothetical protein K438DRAFT_1957628 [Mycena galopus ATCC 62051]
MPPTQTPGDSKILDESFASTVDVVKVNEATAACGLPNFASTVENANEAAAACGFPEATVDLQQGERCADIDLHIFQEAHRFVEEAYRSGTHLVMSYDMACRWRLEKVPPTSEDQLKVWTAEDEHFELMRRFDRWHGRSTEGTSSPEDWEGMPELEEISNSDSD